MVMLRFTIVYGDDLGRSWYGGNRLKLCRRSQSSLVILVGRNVGQDENKPKYPKVEEVGSNASVLYTQEVYSQLVGPALSTQNSAFSNENTDKIGRM